MAAEAYDAAEGGDYSIVRELQALLAAPYDEQSAEAAAQWAQVCPAPATDGPRGTPEGRPTCLAAATLKAFKGGLS